MFQPLPAKALICVGSFQPGNNHYRGGNWGRVRSNNLSKVSQLGRDGAETEPRLSQYGSKSNPNLCAHLVHLFHCWWASSRCLMLCSIDTWGWTGPGRGGCFVHYGVTSCTPCPDASSTPHHHQGVTTKILSRRGQVSLRERHKIIQLRTTATGGKTIWGVRLANRIIYRFLLYFGRNTEIILLIHF